MKYLTMIILSIFMLVSCGEKQEEADSQELADQIEEQNNVPEEMEEEATDMTVEEKVIQAVDQSKPEGVVQAVFDAANTKNYSMLEGLCAPDCDNDCKMICELEAENEDEFIEYFSTGKINGEAKIDGEKAEVAFTFGPDGNREEVMNLVNIDGKWYLQSF